MPPALSATGPYASVASVTPRVLNIPTPATATAAGVITLSSVKAEQTFAVTAGTFEDVDGAAWAGTTITLAAGTADTLQTAVTIKDIDITDALGSQQALEIVDKALTAVNSARADLGAVQNRFTSTIANLSASSENISAAKGRITDADFASETANLTRAQILQQAGTAMLAQANSLPQNVLSLLQ